jgi:hypothetical protein
MIVALVGGLVLAEEIPLSGPALAAVIAAFSGITAMFIGQMFRANKVMDKSTATVVAMHEVQHEEDEAEIVDLKAQLQAKDVRHSQELQRERRDKARLAEECAAIRNERDLLLLEVDRLRHRGEGKRSTSG